MTESGWLRSGVTVTPVGGGEERMMTGARGGRGDEGEEVVGVCVGGSVGEPHEMEDGGLPAQSCISLMNSQSMFESVNGNRMVRCSMLVSDRV